MKVYVQFTQANVSRTEIQDACGSDAVYPLDGRRTLIGHTEDAFKRMEELERVRSFDGFKIVRSGRFDGAGTILHTWTDPEVLEEVRANHMRKLHNGR